VWAQLLARLAFGANQCASARGCERQDEGGQPGGCRSLARLGPCFDFCSDTALPFPLWPLKNALAWVVRSNLRRLGTYGYETAARHAVHGLVKSRWLAGSGSHSA
jgi:hypothetical protein